MSGKDAVFILDNKTRQELIQEDASSRRLIKPIVKGKDLQKYAAPKQIRWLIASHNGHVNDSGITVAPVKIDDFPAIKKYLDRNFERIKNRQDQGRTPYNLRSCKYMSSFEKEKIIYPEIEGDGPKFSIDRKQLYVHQTCYIITGEHLKYLIAILNSSIFTYFYHHFYAGAVLGDKGIRYEKTFFDQVPIPLREGNEKIAKLLERAVDKIEDAIASGKDCRNQEKLINSLVRKLYGVKDDLGAK